MTIGPGLSDDTSGESGSKLTRRVLIMITGGSYHPRHLLSAHHRHVYVADDDIESWKTSVRVDSKE